MSLHQKHSKFSIFQSTLSPGYPSRYTRSTQNSQLFRISSHFGIHLVTPKALKILNFSGYPLTWISMSLHQKYSKFSIFQATLSPGYPSRYTKGTQNSELFRISSHLGIHVVSSKALKIVNFSGYHLTWVSMFLHQKHSKFSTFKDIFSLVCPCGYTKSTQNPQFL